MSSTALKRVLVLLCVVAVALGVVFGARQLGLPDIYTSLTTSPVVDGEELSSGLTEEQLRVQDGEVTDAVLAMERPIKINISTYEDALAIIEGIEDVSGIYTVGSFVISGEMMAQIQNEIDRLVSAGAATSFLMLDLETGAGLAYDIDKPRYSASSIKAHSMCGTCYYAPEAFEKSNYGIYSTLVNSSNDAYSEVIFAYDSSITDKWRARAHLNPMEWLGIYTNYSVREFAQLWTVNWDYLTQEGEIQETLRKWMGDTRYSVFAAELGIWNGYTVVSKGGWEFGEYAVSCEGGYVVSPGGTYLLCVMSDRGAHPDDLLGKMVYILDDAYQEYSTQKERETAFTAGDSAA